VSETGNSPPATDLGSITIRSLANQVTELRELNDILAAKVAEWKARAEKAEAALKAAEDDRHLATPCA
jgi:hypothetical protein